MKFLGVEGNDGIDGGAMIGETVRMGSAGNGSCGVSNIFEKSTFNY